MHARQQIREAIATLVTGLSTTGATVYQSRVYPIDTLPSLSVYSLNEEVEDTQQNGAQTRVLTVVIEGRVKAVSNYDDTLDTIAEEVETAIMADQFLSALSADVKLTELQETTIELYEDLEKPCGVVSLRFHVLYRVNESDPSTLID